MDIFGGYFIPFLIVLTVLVFVHEWGHYIVARWNNVRVEVFSVGFGPELFGRTDKAGTRWRISAIPLGGYVRFFGDADATSSTQSDASSLTEQERAVSFHEKSVGQRAAIVFAGPAANFLFAVLLLAVLFASYGHPFPSAVVGTVQPGSPAEQAGIQPQDQIVRVGDREISRFVELPSAIQSAEPGKLTITVVRTGTEQVFELTPELVDVEATDGSTVQIRRIGVGALTEPMRPFAAIGQATEETFSIAWLTLGAVAEMISGARGTEELGGPIRIAQMSGNVAQAGVTPLLWFIAILSINLGLINLFPVPMLDGGHLMFYAVEALRGRPLNDRAQEIGFRIGLALVLTLVVFTTWNDLDQLNVLDYIRGLFS